MAYTVSATTKGGRNGRAILDNGGLALAMGLQKEFGGNGEGHNPEQLFVLGWSACFGQAILALAKKHGLDGQDARVTCSVAMDNATRNAGDMIRPQTLIYNRTRQAMIPKELIEIISGAEAL